MLHVGIISSVKATIPWNKLIPPIDNFLLTLKWVILSRYKGVAHSNMCVVVSMEMPLAERRVAVSLPLCFPLTLSWWFFHRLVTESERKLTWELLKGWNHNKTMCYYPSKTFWIQMTEAHFFWSSISTGVFVLDSSLKLIFLDNGRFPKAENFEATHCILKTLWWLLVLGSLKLSWLGNAWKT